MARGVICQKCGVEAPTKYVEFYYNIGALVVRHHKQIKGNLCKRCIHKTFWRFTMMDVTLGWWGMISFFITPVFLINNVVRYLAAIPMPATPADAVRPELTLDASGKIDKYRKELVDRLNKKEPLTDVAESIGRSAGVTPGQVVLHIRALSQARPGTSQQTRAFPVVPVAPQAVPVPVPAIPIEAPPAAVPPPLPPKTQAADMLGDFGI